MDELGIMAFIRLSSKRELLKPKRKKTTLKKQNDEGEINKKK